MRLELQEVFHLPEVVLNIISSPPDVLAMNAPRLLFMARTPFFCDAKNIDPMKGYPYEARRSAYWTELPTLHIY